MSGPPGRSEPVDLLALHPAILYLTVLGPADVTDGDWLWAVEGGAEVEFFLGLDGWCALSQAVAEQARRVAP